jgi:hypothetical protein
VLAKGWLIMLGLGEYAQTACFRILTSLAGNPGAHPLAGQRPVQKHHEIIDACQALTTKGEFLYIEL